VAYRLLAFSPNLWGSEALEGLSAFRMIAYMSRKFLWKVPIFRCYLEYASTDVCDRAFTPPRFGAPHSKCAIEAQSRLRGSRIFTPRATKRDTFNPKSVTTCPNRKGLGRMALNVCCRALHSLKSARISIILVTTSTGGSRATWSPEFASIA
jgi:hypothetical protein